MQTKQILRTLLLAVVLVGLLWVVIYLSWEYIVALSVFVSKTYSWLSKAVFTLAFWKQIALVSGKTAQKAILRQIFIYLPQAFLSMLVVAYLFRPKRRREFRGWVARRKKVIMKRYADAQWWYESYFGAFWYVAIAMTVCLSILVATFVTILVGEVVPVWLGSWYYVTQPMVWIWAQVMELWALVRSPMMNALHRIPGFTAVLGLGQKGWAATFGVWSPRFTAWIVSMYRRSRKKAIKLMIRKGLIHGKKISSTLHDRKVRREENLLMRRLWPAGHHPIWSRINWQQTDLWRYPFEDASMADERLYRRVLGEDKKAYTRSGGHATQQRLRSPHRIVWH